MLMVIRVMRAVWTSTTDTGMRCVNCFTLIIVGLIIGPRQFTYVAFGVKYHLTTFRVHNLHTACKDPLLVAE